MRTDRRGFIGALLAVPLAAKLLPAETWFMTNNRTLACVFGPIVARDQYAPLLASWAKTGIQDGGPIPF